MPRGDDVTITIHQPYKCGYQATAVDTEGNVAVARGYFGAGYPTEALARAAVRRIMRKLRKS
jgi:hypothetical protein